MDSDLPRIDPEDVNATTPILDVRAHTGSEQIRGAVHYDPAKLDNSGKLILPLPHDGPIAVYAETEERAAEVVRLLIDADYSGAAVLSGGLDAWRNAGLPTEASTAEQPIPGNESAGAELL